MDTGLRSKTALITGGASGIGNAVAFLLSDQMSGYTLGSDRVIDGGLTLHPLGLYSQEAIDGFNR